MSACYPSPPVMLPPETVSHCVCGEAAPRQHVRVGSRADHQFLEHHVCNFINTLHLELLVGNINIINCEHLLGPRKETLNTCDALQIH